MLFFKRATLFFRAGDYPVFLAQTRKTGYQLQGKCVFQTRRMYIYIKNELCYFFFLDPGAFGHPALLGLPTILSACSWTIRTKKLG
jgi:hypothetical protein